MRTTITLIAIALVLAILQSPPSLAATDEPSVTRKYALVIGNSAYSGIPTLKNPKNDAIAVANTLRRLDFNVYDGIDLSLERMQALLQEFSREADKDADVVLFYFAGHGFQFNGKNFLVPTDATFGEDVAPESQTLRLDHIITTLQRPSHTTLVFLDACRDNPLADKTTESGTRSTGRGLVRIHNDGLAQIDVAKGTFIAFATNPGNVALDGDGDHSPFTQALLNNIERPGLSISDIMIGVRNEVALATSNRQTPWDQSSLNSQFYFKAALKPNPERLQEQAYWSAVKESRDVRLIRTYPERYPDGLFAEEAKLLLAKLAPQGGRLGSGPGNIGPDDPLAGKALVRGIQSELARLGCSPGAIDGDWGPRSKGALRRFVNHSKAKIDGSSAPSVALYSALSNYSGNKIVCPVERRASTSKGKVAQSSSKRRNNSIKSQASISPKKPSAPKLPPDLSIGVGIGM